MRILTTGLNLPQMVRGSNTRPQHREIMIHLNSFCSKRQTEKSSLTHWEISNVRLVELATAEVEAGRTKAGYRDGVVLVSVNPAGFKTGVVELEDGDQLIGEYSSRREGETPRISIYVGQLRKFPTKPDSRFRYRSVSGKQPAKMVEVVLYRHDVLVENNENETDAEWEIVSVNGHPTDEPAPIAPETLMHNHFGSDGGSNTNMTPEEFERAMRESFNYWKNKGMVTAS